MLGKAARGVSCYHPNLNGDVGLLTEAGIGIAIPWRNGKVKIEIGRKVRAVHNGSFADRTPGEAVILTCINHAGVPVNNCCAATRVGQWRS